MVRDGTGITLEVPTWGGCGTPRVKGGTLGGVHGTRRRAAESNPFIIQLPRSGWGTLMLDVRDSAVVLAKILGCLFCLAENEFTFTLWNAEFHVVTGVKPLAFLPCFILFYFFVLKQGSKQLRSFEEGQHRAWVLAMLSLAVWPRLVPVTFAGPECLIYKMW